MPNIPIKSYLIIRYCIDRFVSNNPEMIKLARVNDIPIIKQNAATFSFSQFLRGRNRQRIYDSKNLFQVLHVGHLNKKRNVFELAKLCNKLNFSLTFLVSSTEKEDKEERARLESLGVKIVTGYQDDLYEFYQKFDLYAFPVKRSDAAISMPLSIIEALLSGLSVLCMDFGEISRYFNNSKCVEIVKSFEELTASRLRELAVRPVINMENLKDFDSQSLAQAIVDHK